MPTLPPARRTRRAGADADIAADKGGDHRVCLRGRGDKRADDTAGKDARDAGIEPAAGADVAADKEVVADIDAVGGDTADVCGRSLDAVDVDHREARGVVGNIRVLARHGDAVGQAGRKREYAGSVRSGRVGDVYHFNQPRVVRRVRVPARHRNAVVLAGWLVRAGERRAFWVADINDEQAFARVGDVRVFARDVHA